MIRPSSIKRTSGSRAALPARISNPVIAAGSLVFVIPRACARDAEIRPAERGSLMLPRDLTHRRRVHFVLARIQEMTRNLLSGHDSGSGGQATRETAGNAWADTRACARRK